MRIRTRSDQSVTSAAILSAVRISPKPRKVVRPSGSQRGSQPNTAHGTVTPWRFGVTILTRLADLALLCSNCHRMIHRTKQWLTVEELKELVEQQRKLASAVPYR